MSEATSKLARGYVLLVTAEVVAKGVTFAAFGFLARQVGTTGQGFVEFAVAVTMCASLVIDLGFNPFGAREIARDPHRTSALVGEIVLARLGLALVAVGVVVALALSVPRPPAQVTVLFVYALSLLPMPLLLQWVFQGHNQMVWVAIATVLRQMVFAAMVIALVRGMDQIVWVAIAEVAGVVAAALFCLVVYRRRFEGTIPLGRGVSRQLFREGVPIGLGQLFWAGRMFAGTILLGYIATADEVGMFGAAHRILVAAHTFVWWYFFNLLATMTRSWHADRDGFRDLLRQSLSVVLWCGLLSATVGVLAARWLMITVYGAAFADGAPVLQAFAVVCLILAISGHYRFGLIAAGYQKQEMITAGVGALVAIVLIAMGFKAWGITGAALGLLASEVLVWAMTWALSRRLLGATRHGWCFLRPAAALVASGVAFYLARSTSGGVGAVLAVAVIIVAAFLDTDFRTRGWRLMGQLARRST